MNETAMGLKHPTAIDLQAPETQARRVARHTAAPHQLLRSTLLQSTDGRLMQAVFPAPCLLDLQALQRADTEWRALPPTLRGHLLKPQQLESMPALPGTVPDVTLRVDEQCLALDTVFVESGHAEYLLKFTRDEYQTLLHEHSVEIDHFAVPLTQARPNLDAPQQDEQEIRQAVDTITRRRVRARLAEEIEIAPLPISTQQLMALRDREDVSTHELANVIESDPSLASQVISWANSPYYGAPGTVRSIHDAVIRVLGFDLTMNLALGLALSRQLQLPKDGVHGYQHFWRDAVKRALMVDAFARIMPPLSRPISGLAYIAGLLHNFGYLILAEVFPPYFSLYCRYQEANPHVPPMYLERFLFGITREQIASHLFQTWGLPEAMCVAVRHQHNPRYHGDHFKYANLLYLAHQYQHPYREQQLKRVPAAIYERLELDPELALTAWQRLEEVGTEQVSELVRLLEHGHG